MKKNIINLIVLNFLIILNTSYSKKEQSKYNKSKNLNSKKNNKIEIKSNEKLLEELSTEIINFSKLDPSKENTKDTLLALKDFIEKTKNKIEEKLNEEKEEFNKQIFLFTDSEISDMKNDAKKYFDDNYELYAKEIIGSKYFEEEELLELLLNSIAENAIYIPEINEDKIYEFFDTSNEEELESIKKILKLIKKINSNDKKGGNEEDFLKFFFKSIGKLIFDEKLIKKIITINEEKKTRIISIIKN